MSEASALNRPQVFRRDFLVGSAAGFVATQSIGWARDGIRRFPEEATPSFAQNGEDLIVKAIFEHWKIDRPTYLDIGAYLPITFNNTYLLYKQGGRGVLVEPNVGLIRELQTKRPGDVVLNIGIGIDEQEAADYYCMSYSQWNTFDKEEAERRVRDTKGEVRITKVLKMPLVPINRVIEEHFGLGGLDYLSIDVETLELPILRTLDFERFRPKVICTETLVHMTDQMDPATTEFLNQHGYEPRGMTFANTIYVDRRLSG